MMNMKKQRGDFLIESLVGMVLMAIIGVGVVSVTGKVSIAHQDMNIQTIAINQMRSRLSSNGFAGADICTASQDFELPTGDTVVVELQGCNAGVRATMNVVISDPGGAQPNKTVENVPQPILLSASSSAFNGDIVVGGTW